MFAVMFAGSAGSQSSMTCHDLDVPKCKQPLGKKHRGVDNFTISCSYFKSG